MNGKGGYLLASTFLLFGCHSNAGDGKVAARRPNRSSVDYVACVGEVIRLNPQVDAKRDVASGKPIPFLVHATDPADEIYAPGLRNCDLGYDALKVGARKIGGYTDPGDLAGMPARNCSLAMARYKVAYNRALVRQTADHLRGVCGEAVRIDATYPSFDDDLERAIKESKSTR